MAFLYVFFAFCFYPSLPSSWQVRLLMDFWPRVPGGSMPVSDGFHAMTHGETVYNCQMVMYFAFLASLLQGVWWLLGLGVKDLFDSRWFNRLLCRSARVRAFGLRQYQFRAARQQKQYLAYGFTQTELEPLPVQGEPVHVH